MNHVTTIVQPIEAEMKRLKNLLKEVLDSTNPLLQAVVEHTLRRNGKMMRPMLTMLMAKLCGGISDAAYHTALALELLHTASLMHDDVVDESDERRGQPSVKAAFSTKTAVLAGDYFLATALWQVSLTQNQRIISRVAQLGQELTDGELMQLAVSTKTSTARRDMNSEGMVPRSLPTLDPLYEEHYYNIVRKKTASLFATCAQTGALAANASDEMAENARLFGEYVGISFQIKDDIFDYFSNAEVGKPTGNDMREGKLTLPALYALHTNPLPEALALAQRVGDDTLSTAEIGELIEFSKANGGIDYAQKAMSEYRDRALALLPHFPQNDGTVISALTAFAHCVVDRSK